MVSNVVAMSDPLRADDLENYEGLFAQLAEQVERGELTPGNKPSRWKEKFADRKISPRLRMAAKLYHSGIAKTLGEAAKMASLAPATLYAMNISDNEEFNRICTVADKERDIATGDISLVLQRLGRNALTTIEELRAKSESESIRLKAAIDLADRSPETSKITKLQVASLSMDGKDVESLTKALVEAEHVRAKYAEVATGDFVRVSTEAPTSELAALPKPKEEVITDV